MLIIIGAILFILYFTNAFPDFNAKIDKTTIEIVPPKELIPPIIIDGIVASELTPYFNADYSLNNKKLQKPALSTKGNNFLEYDLSFSLFNDAYSLKSTGVFERLNSNYIGTTYPESTWEYHGDFPIVSQPSLFADSLVFIDAEPKLVQLDIQSGRVINTQFSPAYPDKTAAILNNSYIFSARNGSTYAFDFLPSRLEIPKITQNDLQFSSLFAYDEKIKNTLQNMLSSWMGTSDIVNLQAPLLLADFQSPYLIPIRTGEILVFAYTPQEQGTYTVGLSDENGIWLTTQAFSSVFTSQGNLLSVSIDYIADKPQTSLHLSPNEFYYIAVGIFSETDNNVVSEMDQIDSTIDSYYIMAKKTL